MPPSHCSNPLYDSVQGPTSPVQYDTIIMGNHSAGTPDVSGYFASSVGAGNIQESSSSIIEKDDTIK